MLHKFLIATSLTIFAIISHYTNTNAIAAFSLDSTTISFTQPEFPPNLGSPSRGRGKGAASFSGQNTNDSEYTCLAESPNLIALVPQSQRNKVWGLTTLRHPSFFFAIPQLPDEIKIAEFVLEDTESQGLDPEIYRTQVNLPQQSGVIHVNLPNIEKYALNVNTKYKWLFKIICSSNEEEPSSIFVTGNIIRVYSNEYSTDELWYDLIKAKAKQLSDQPSNVTFQENWQELLEDINLGNLAEMNLLPCCTPNSDPSNSR